MNEKFNKTLDIILNDVPGIIGIIIINHDGIPIYFNGRFDISLNKLSAYLAVCCAILDQAGKLFQQEIYTILTEYDKLKLYQIKITSQYSLIIMFKINNAYLGEIRRRISKAVEELSLHFPE